MLSTPGEITSPIGQGRRGRTCRAGEEGGHVGQGRRGRTCRAGEEGEDM